MSSSFTRKQTLTALLVILIALAAVPVLSGQTTPLAAQLVTRAVTNDDIKNYTIPTTAENSGGLTAVGVGQPFYLEADVDGTIPATQIAGVTWKLTSQPSNSTATLSDNPLPATVPVFEPSDRLIYQVAGRSLLRPDVPGSYVVTATIATAANGSATLSISLTAGTYVGISACTQCHSGGAPGSAWSTENAWSTTAHSQIFTNSINGKGAMENGVPYPYTSACWGCHTVGYDANDQLVDGGFSQLMTQLGWVAPTTLQAGNFAAMPASLQNVSNIQCENCHGAGSVHVGQGGNPYLTSRSFTSGVCAQCHAESPFHVKFDEWSNSTHAIATRDPSGAGQEACVGCHTANGFIGKMSGISTLNGYFGATGPTVDTTYNAINCQTCHEPHGQTAPSTNLHLIRTTTPVTLKNAYVVNSGGMGTLCMNCHQSRQNAEAYVASTPGGAHWGPHHGTQGDMLMGTNAITYGKEIPSGAHGDAVADTCVTCHMQTVASTDPALGQVGGHTFKLTWPGTSTTPGEQPGGRLSNLPRI